MTLLAAALAVLVMVATGLVLFRRLARYLLAGNAGPLPSEQDLALLGILPGLALIGILLTCLGVTHLLRPWIIVPLIAGIFWFLRQDAQAVMAGIQDSLRQISAAARRGNLLPILAVFAGLVCLVLAFLLCLIPAEVVDVWAYHVPLAQSFIAHGGFVYPQIPSLFYGNQPLLFELLFSASMMAVPNYVAASAVSIAIFFGFLLLVLSFADRARGLQFLLICAIFVWSKDFLLDAHQPMIDLPRSCFSVAAYFFAYRYACNFRRFDLVMSALLAGTAVAGKYTELVTPLLIGIALVPLMATRRQTWMHLLPAALAFIVAAGFWYAKNAILYGNPVYPFLLGHPGFSDAWMAGYMHEMSTPFDIGDRAYSTNLRTLRGWHDFAVVLHVYFRSLAPFAVLTAAGLLLPRPRRWMMPLWIVLLFLIWYAVMFNGTRWALPGVLLLVAATFITWFWVADRLLALWDAGRFAAWRDAGGKLPALASAVIVVAMGLGAAQFARGHGHFILPRWMTREMAVALLHPGGVDAYLSETRQGYALYRYIGEHNLAHVFQPFDNGAVNYASAYNGGHPNDWVIGYTDLPANLQATDAFLAKNDIHYFVDAGRLTPAAAERLGAAHVALARAVVAKLKPHATPLMHDSYGNTLYRIADAR